MKPLIKPSAILFDFDDTLVKARPIIDKALTATFAKMKVSEDIINIKNIDTNRSLREYFHHIFADNIIEARDTYYKYYTEFSKDLEEFDHSEAVLQLLKRNNVFTAVVSNKVGSRLRSEINERFGWQKYFAAIVGSGDVTEDKPSPMAAIFALQSSGLINYRDVWFIGDSLVDLETAQNLGCKGILFGSNNQVAEAKSVYFSVENHNELLNILEGIYA